MIGHKKSSGGISVIVKIYWDRYIIFTCGYFVSLMFLVENLYTLSLSLCRIGPKMEKSFPGPILHSRCNLSSREKDVSEEESLSNEDIFEESWYCRVVSCRVPVSVAFVSCVQEVLCCFGR